MNLRAVDKNNLDELKFIYSVRTHPAVAAELIGNAPPSFQHHVTWVNSNIDCVNRWLFLCLHNEAMLGYAQLYNFTEDSLEVGWALHPDFQGKGLGTLAVEATLLEVCLRFPSLNTVKLEVKISNPKAHHIYSKLGFKDIARTNDLILMEKPNVKS